MRKPSLDGFIFMIGIGVLSLFFAWLLRCCFYSSESFDILALKNVDEILFQRILEQFREMLKNGNWIQALAKSDCGYGTIFWIPLALISVPIAAWGPDWALIVMPRIISLLAYGLCFFAFYKICRRRGVLAGNAVLGLILLASCRGIFTSALYFHNNTIIPALVLWSFYILMLPSTRRNKIWAVVIFSMALGMKLTTLFVLPIFLLFFNQNFYLWEIFLPRFYLRHLKVVALVLATSLFFLSPTVLLIPFGNLIFYNESINSILYILLYSPQMKFSGAHEFVTDVYFNICGYMYHWLIFLVGLLIGFFALYLRRRKKISDILFSAAGILSLLMIAFLVIFNSRDPYFLHFYVIPLIFSFSFVFVDMPLPAGREKGLLFLLIFVSFYLVGQSWKEDLFFTKNIEASVESQEKIQRFDVLKKQVRLDPGAIVSLDFTLIYPFGSLAAYQNVLFFYQPGEPIDVKADVYILSKKNMIQAEREHFNTSQFEKIFSDSGMEIFRRRAELLE